MSVRACEFPPRPRRPARRATDPRPRRYIYGNEINGTLPLALCDVQDCSANPGKPDLVAPCGMSGCCGLDNEETCAPTATPSDAPTATPSDAPTAKPSDAPTPLAELCAAAGFDVECTAKPSDAPTAKPSDAPSAKPSDVPTAKPSDAPSAKPSDAPTAKPSDAPTAKPAQDAGEFGQGDGSFTEPDACSGLAKKTCKYVPNKRKCKRAGCRWNKKKEKCLAKRIKD